MKGQGFIDCIWIRKQKSKCLFSSCSFRKNCEGLASDWNVWEDALSFADLLRTCWRLTNRSCSVCISNGKRSLNLRLNDSLLLAIKTLTTNLHESVCTITASRARLSYEDYSNIHSPFFNTTQVLLTLLRHTVQNLICCSETWLFSLFLFLNCLHYSLMPLWVLYLAGGL